METLVCQKCGRSIPSNSKFCPYCGSEIPVAKPVDNKPLEPSDRESSSKSSIIIFAFIVVVIVSLAYMILHKEHQETGDYQKAYSTSEEYAMPAVEDGLSDTVVEFNGSVNDRYRFHMFLNRYQGYYYYESQGSDKTITLEVVSYERSDSNSYRVVLKEIIDGCYNCTFDGILYNSNQYSGSFITPEGKYRTFSATKY